MFLTSYIFKSKAVRALKGNWQTALVVAFVAGLPATLMSLLQSRILPEMPVMTDMVDPEVIFAYVGQIPAQTTWLLIIASAVSFIVTPVLKMGCNYYFIKRLQGEDLGMMGAFSRRNYFWRALVLEILIYVRVLLWGLLFFVPGIIAALRYSMAPYFLAEDPSLTPTEAIEKSKKVMADKKMSYVMLFLSFIGWILMAMVVETMFLAFSVILALVANQFVNLFRITYWNASETAFYLAASRVGGIAGAKKEADQFMQQMGVRPPGALSGDEEDAENDEDDENDKDDGDDSNGEDTD